MKLNLKEMETNELIFKIESTYQDSLQGTCTVNGTNVCKFIKNKNYPIPNGRYLATFYESPHNGKVLLLHNVPNHSYVEIHPANEAKQLRGCAAPCTSIFRGKGQFSNVALNNIFKSLTQNQPIYVTFK